MVGTSEVNVEEIPAASKYFKVATVQNKYNLLDRESDSTLDYCEKRNIGFIPWYPLAASAAYDGECTDSHRQEACSNAGTGRPRVAAPAQSGDAAHSGTSSVEHLKENVAAAAIKLSDEDVKALDER